MEDFFAIGNCFLCEKDVLSVHWHLRGEPVFFTCKDCDPLGFVQVERQLAAAETADTQPETQVVVTDET